MTKGLLLALIVAFGLGGCAGLTQFPEVTNNYDKALRDLDNDYAVTLARIYGPPPEEKGTPATGASTSAFVSPTPEEQKQIRQGMMERRMAVIDAYFKEFQDGLVKENVRAEFGLALVGIGVGAAGALVPQTASQILSAVSGGLAGAQAAYGKAVFYDKAMSALIAQMQAGRKTVAVQIFERWNWGLDQYPMWMAKTHLDAYYFAGSLPGAILGTAADAAVKAAAADRKIETLSPVTKAQVDKIARLTDAIKKLVDPKLDLPKIKKAITTLDKNVTPSDDLETAKTQLQVFVLDLPIHPENIDKVTNAFKDANISLE